MSRLPVSGRSPNPPLSSLSKAGRRCPAFCFSLLFSLAPILSCNPSHTPSQSQTSVQAPANRLSDESSPYLRQHAHNPVDRYPWGPAALAVAREQNKPIFLSIGYSSCYWYHVMEREVFENPELAARMNAGFVNIKVDREERPDLDAIYMTATQILSGQGGWPNSIFLTPELAPFFAGTYFPPVDRHGRPGFGRLLDTISAAWGERSAEIRIQAKEVTARITRIHNSQSEAANLNAELLEDAAEELHLRYNKHNGGFGGAPSFRRTPRSISSFTSTIAKVTNGLLT